MSEKKDFFNRPLAGAATAAQVNSQSTAAPAGSRFTQAGQQAQTSTQAAPTFTQSQTSAAAQQAQPQIQPQAQAQVQAQALAGQFNQQAPQSQFQQPATQSQTAQQVQPFQQTQATQQADPNQAGTSAAARFLSRNQGNQNTFTNFPPSAGANNNYGNNQGNSSGNFASATQGSGSYQANNQNNQGSLQGDNLGSNRGYQGGNQGYQGSNQGGNQSYQGGNQGGNQGNRNPFSVTGNGITVGPNGGGGKVGTNLPPRPNPIPPVGGVGGVGGVGVITDLDLLKQRLDKMVRAGYSFVLFFGQPASGKSSVKFSLLRFLTQEGVDVIPETDFFLRDSDVDTFSYFLEQVRRGEFRPERTAQDLPDIWPLELSSFDPVNKKSYTKRMAFVDFQGEDVRKIIEEHQFPEYIKLFLDTPEVLKNMAIIFTLTLEEDINAIKLDRERPQSQQTLVERINYRLRPREKQAETIIPRAYLFNKVDLKSDELLCFYDKHGIAHRNNQHNFASLYQNEFPWLAHTVAQSRPWLLQIREDRNAEAKFPHLFAYYCSVVASEASGDVDTNEVYARYARNLWLWIQNTYKRDQKTRKPLALMRNLNYVGNLDFMASEFDDYLERLRSKPDLYNKFIGVDAALQENEFGQLLTELSYGPGFDYRRVPNDVVLSPLEYTLLQADLDCKSTPAKSMLAVYGPKVAQLRRNLVGFPDANGIWWKQLNGEWHFSLAQNSEHWISTGFRTEEATMPSANSTEEILYNFAARMLPTFAELGRDLSTIDLRLEYDLELERIRQEEERLRREEEERKRKAEAERKRKEEEERLRKEREERERQEKLANERRLRSKLNDQLAAQTSFPDFPPTSQAKCTYSLQSPDGELFQVCLGWNNHTASFGAKVAHNGEWLPVHPQVLADHEIDEINQVLATSVIPQSVTETFLECFNAFNEHGAQLGYIPESGASFSGRAYLSENHLVLDSNLESVINEFCDQWTQFYRNQMFQQQSQQSQVVSNQNTQEDKSGFFSGLVNKFVG